MHDDTFNLVSSTTLRESAAEVLRRAIMSGAFPPGMPINQAELAKQLGISRSPLREALGMLEEEGLVKIVPFKGAYVAELSPQFIDEIYSLRLVLEAFAVQRAVEQATPDAIADLRRILTEMQAAAAADDRLRLIQVDLDFHRAIVIMARHSLLLQAWKGLESKMRQTLTLRHLAYPLIMDVIGTHPDVVAAIEAGDPDAAAAAMRAHISEAWAILAGAGASDTTPRVAEDDNAA